MKDIGKQIKLMVWESLLKARMELVMKVIGLMISNMVMVLNHGKMDQLVIQANSIRERNMARVNLSGMMVLTMKETLLMDSLKASVNTILQT